MVKCLRKVSDNLGEIVDDDKEIKLGKIYLQLMQNLLLSIIPIGNIWVILFVILEFE